MYNVWRTTVILIVTMYTEFVLYYTMLIVLNKFNSIQFNSIVDDPSSTMDFNVAEIASARASSTKSLTVSLRVAGQGL